MPLRQHTKIRRSRQAGVSLIEVLVTVVIIAVGLLGIAALQIMSKRSNFEASERTIATQLANDILERMRTNRHALESYASTAEAPPAALGEGSTRFPAEPSPNCGSSGAGCDKDKLAVHDLWEWEQKLLGAAETASGGAATGGLTLPTACLTTTVAAGLADRSGRYSVAVAWRGPVELTDPTNPVGPEPSYNPYACGRDGGALGTGLYDGATNKNGHRRILVVDTYIDAR